MTVAWRSGPQGGCVLTAASMEAVPPPVEAVSAPVGKMTAVMTAVSAVDAREGETYTRAYVSVRIGAVGRITVTAVINRDGDAS
jgi:hypothetical protein